MTYSARKYLMDCRSELSGLFFGTVFICQALQKFHLQWLVFVFHWGFFVVETTQWIKRVFICYAFIGQWLSHLLVCRKAWLLLYIDVTWKSVFSTSVIFALWSSHCPSYHGLFFTSSDLNIHIWAAFKSICNLRLTSDS